MGISSNGIIYGLKIYYKKNDQIIMLFSETYNSPINDINNLNLITNNEVIQKINDIKSEILQNESIISINIYSNISITQNENQIIFIWMPFSLEQFKIMFNL